MKIQKAFLIKLTIILLGIDNRQFLYFLLAINLMLDFAFKKATTIRFVMKKKFWVIIALLAAALLARWYFSSDADKENISFKTHALDRGDIEMIISASGTLNAV